ncbi:MAG: hypothetical protein ABJA90_10645 [Ginsengibacter sp.]
MANKHKKGKSNQQNSLQGKELQKFFNKMKGVMLVPKDKKFQGLDYPVLSILFDEATYINFQDYGINKIIVDLLDDKYPVLFIRVDESDKVMAGFSIFDKDFDLRFRLPDQPIGEPLLKFVKSTIPISKIVMIAGYFKDNQVLFAEDVKNNPLLILDGYLYE